MHPVLFTIGGFRRKSQMDAYNAPSDWSTLKVFLIHFLEVEPSLALSPEAT
jgi:hypothetical protein